MSRPSVYTRVANFIYYALNHSSAPYNPADHDAEFNAVRLALTETQNVLNSITRTDGKLANNSVGLDTITGQLLAMFIGKYTSLNVVGAWSALYSFKFGDIVTNGGGTYLATVTHISSNSFANDMTAGNWAVLNYPQGTAGGSATLDTNALIPLAQIPLLSLDKIPVLNFTKLPTLTGVIRSQTTVDFGSVPNQSATVTIALAGMTLTTPVNATMDSKVGDTIGDELQMDGFSVSAKCLATDTLTINVVCLTGFALGQYVVNYDYIKTLS